MHSLMTPNSHFSQNNSKDTTFVIYYVYQPSLSEMSFFTSRITNIGGQKMLPNSDEDYGNKLLPFLDGGIQC